MTKSALSVRCVAATSERRSEGGVCESRQPLSRRNAEIDAGRIRMPSPPVLDAIVVRDQCSCRLAEFRERRGHGAFRLVRKLVRPMPGNIPTLRLDSPLG